MRDFYDAFYAVVDHSHTHHAFCEAVFGLDLCQHGFADMAQLALLLDVTGLNATHHALDLGCGNGMITEWLADQSGAQITGLDFIPAAIRQAQQRTATKSARLRFVVGDINHLTLRPLAFDVIISIDSLYFSDDDNATIHALNAALCPGGRMAILYSYGREPWVPREEFPVDTLAPDKTTVATALKANGLTFQTWDLTAQDYALAQRRKEVLATCKAQFEAEGTTFIYDNRMGDARGICQAIEEGLHVRYLYHVTKGDT